MNIDPRLLRKARSSRLPFLLTVVFGFAGGILIVFQARLLSRIIAGVFLDGKTLTAVSDALWVLAGIIIGRALLAFGSEIAANTTAVRVKTGLRIELLAHLQQQGPAYTQGEHSGELTTTALDGVEALQAYFSQYLPQVLLAALIPLTILGIVFPLDFLSGLVLVLTAPLIPVFMVLIGNVSAALTHKQYTSLTRLSAHFLDMLQGLATLKTLNQSRNQARSIARVSEQYRQTTMGVLRVTFLSALVLELVSTISTAIVAVQVGLRLLYGHLGFEEALFILIIAPEFYLPLRNLGLRFHAGMSGTSAAKRIFEILETPLPEPVHPSSSAGHPPAPAKDIFPIRFEQVSYAYQDGKRPAVNEISFTIQSGQKTALVGPSGAGKSTVMQLLLGFIRPDSGAILSHGVDLPQIPMDWWRSQIAWVPQTPYLFHDTLLNNLRLARPAASMEEIHQAARLAHLDEWVDRLPDGYNTDIGEGGARLSGGQAQRVALARAFLRDTPLLLLDEPTASLDPEQEYFLEQATQTLAAQRTVITIAHRLNTIVQADQILVFASGRIVERGEHEALLKNGKLYASLVQHYRGNE